MKNIVILGGGESGVGAALLAKSKGYSVFLSDIGCIKPKYTELLKDNNIDFEDNKHTEAKILDADIIIKSPGIPETAPIIRKIRLVGIDIISEIEFASRYTKAKMCCITGSNGKTTTTMLIWHILNQAGFNVGLAGNIGNSLAAQVLNRNYDIYVVELSSFQLDDMYKFHSNISIITNLTPDHLDRYSYDFSKYIDAKFRILNNMTKSDLFIYSDDDNLIVDKINNMDTLPELASFSLTDKSSNISSFSDGENIIAKYHDAEYKYPIKDLKIRGKHNIYNAMAAIIACLRLGVSTYDLSNGLMTFHSVEHRLESVAEINGILYINDSKATNVDSVKYALDAMERPIIWIAGGVDKGNNYEELYELVYSKVKHLVCMGTDNIKLIDAFSDKCSLSNTHNFDDAMKVVLDTATSGDVVLLSPACASFDLFHNYEDRGRIFKSFINQQKND